MTATMLRSRLESRWSSLKYLDDDSKLDLITMLTQSLKDSGNRKKISASEFYGIWGDDGMSDDEFVEALRETQGLVPVSLSQEENMTVAGTAKLLLFTNEQGKTNNNCY